MNTYPRARVLALAGMLCLYGTGTAQSVFTGYKELLPDTLLPGKMYELHRVMGILAKTSALPSSYPDTVDLKRGASVIRMVGWMGTDGGGITYQVNIPLDAAIGVYNAYSPKGVLLESAVAEVPDVKSIVPRILGGAPRGFRGQTRNFHIEAMGLAFGPLQSSGTFTPALRYAALEKGQDTLLLEQISGTAPYNIGSVIKVPSAASVGLYQLVLERNDGLRTVKDSGFEVWIPEKPVITKVDPDSLIQGEFGMLGITGANLEYSVRQGSYVHLDRNVVKEVFLRKGELILPSNHAAQVYSLPPGASMSIPFDAPLNLPLGGYDLGIVLNGRTDTSFLAEAVRVLPAKPPRYLNFYPDAAVRSSFIATTASLNIQEGFQLASYTLRRGRSILKGKLLTFNGQVQEVRFEPPSDADTGMYSLQVDFPSGQVYRLENVFRLLGMSLSVNPRILSQGADEVLGLSARGADFEFQVPAREGESGLIENARSISLCRNGSCLEGVPGRHFFQAWEVRFKVPEAQPVGVYELRLRTFEPDSVYVNPAAAVIGPKGYRIWNGYAAGDHAPYWSLHADSVGRLLDNIVGNCPSAYYRLESAPAGVEYSYRIEFASAGSEPAAAMLTWKPTSADTGWHAIRYAATGSCEDKVFLMAYVGPKPVTSVRPSSAAAKARTDLRWIRPGGFGIVLDAPASVELLSLTGRTLAKYGRLAGGLHSLAFPSGMRGDAMVLCRIRRSGGDAWLKIPRSH